jgi:hypothetical protein
MIPLILGAEQERATNHLCKRIAACKIGCAIPLRAAPELGINHTYAGEQPLLQADCRAPAECEADQPAL